MNYVITAFFHIIIAAAQVTYAQYNTTIVLGESFNLHSSILNEDRTCLISLPHSYNDASETNIKYPIMILLDGYTHFKAASGIVHFMSSNRNRNYTMPETIIIAIENVDRERDFTVSKIKTKRPNTMGGGHNFLNFIEKELIPYVDKNYRTKENRILVGHSLGGLLTLNAYMDATSLFNGYISVDPSIWWNEQMMKGKVDSIQRVSFKKKLYIATAARDSEVSQVRNKKRHDTLYTLLNNRGEVPLLVKIDYFENESHRSVPLIALYEGLKCLYDEN